MEYGLDEQLKGLCLKIKSELEKTDDETFDAYIKIRDLLESQKTLLETMLLANHLNSLNKTKCDSGGCAGGK